jgi:hypothetical protein
MSSTTADENLNRVGIRSLLRQNHHSTLKRIVTTSQGVVNLTGHIRQLLDRLEVNLRKDTRLIELGEEDPARRQDGHVGV